MESIELYDVGSKVFSAFKELLSLPDSEKLARHHHLVNEEQRFRLWAHSLGLHQQGHTSLDYRVRDAIAVKDVLLGILSELHEHLESLLAIAKGERLPWEPVIDLDGDTDDEDATASDTTPCTPSQHSHQSSENSAQEVSIRLDSLTHHLDVLYGLATKFRNPRNRPQHTNTQLYKHLYIPVGTEDRIEYTEKYIKDCEDIATGIVAYMHRQYLAKWIDSHNREINGKELEDQYAATSHWLIRRTGIANARRQQQFIYWKGHALRLGNYVQDKPTAPSPKQPKIPVVKDKLDNVLAPGAMVNRAASVPTASLTTAAKLHPNFPLDRPTSVTSNQSRVSKVKSPNGEEYLWPPTPEGQVVIMNHYFTCPYCNVICPEQYLRSDDTWRTREEWIGHENQHVLVWHCRAHDKEFETQGEYEEHLNESHPGSSKESLDEDLMALAIGPSLKPHRDCPFCPTGFLEVTEMQKHVIFHLESLALLALPPLENSSIRDSSAHRSDSYEAQHRGRQDSVVRDFEGEKILFENDTYLIEVLRNGDVLTKHNLHQTFPSDGSDDSDDNHLRVESWVRNEENFKSDPPLANDEGTENARDQVFQNRLPRDLDHFLDEITDQLDSGRVTCAIDASKSYIPRDKLREILPLEKVRTIVDHPCFDDFPDKDRLAKAVCHGTDSSNSCLRLMAALIAMETLKYLPRCIAEGMDDGCFSTLTLDNGLLYCQCHETHHSAINEFPLIHHKRRFAEWSRALDAPYIRYNRAKHSHHILRYDDVLPVPRMSKLPKQAGRGPPKVNALAYGGFSEVYQVKLEKSHYDFGDVGMRHPGGLFALKKLTSHDSKTFNMELASLLFSMDNSSQESDGNHVIQLLATFEVPDPSVDGSIYYLLFDWAEGTLNNFWRQNISLVGDRSHCKWMSEQFYALCRALECVHNERQRTLNSIDKNSLERSLHGRLHDANNLYGRHGDIKPDNLLWFSPEHRPDGVLVLSDFGLGRLHTQVSRSNQNPRDMGWTATYRAPEFDLPNGMVSQASDIFGLGCVFLEYVTWFLLGINSVEHEFPYLRMESDIHDFRSDTFFNIRGQQPYLKSSVKDWISKLQSHDNCTQYISQLLEIIRDRMLEPEREKRIPILLLIKKMEALWQACERDASFYLS
ncbi:hypothetical protein Hte_010780 [Hypoxylon texense]